jgi:transcriptional regulator with XRE-family HTH domain
MDFIIKNIKTVRSARGYSQEYMAKKLAMAQNNYGKIERGITKLTLDKVERIAEILDIPMNHLFSDDMDGDIFLIPREERVKLGIDDGMTPDPREIRRIKELEKIVQNSVSLSELEKLEDEILKNIVKGLGLIYLNYDSERGQFDTKYAELKKIPSKEELGSIAMEKTFGKILDDRKKDAKPRI